jgi:5-methylcytosine-specific restriction endonuclease McrA
MTAKHAGRRGRPYERARKQALTTTVCWICGHDGARTADHQIPRSVCLANGWHHLLNDPANMRPAHGTGNMCPVCGQACNQKRGTGIKPKKAGGKSRIW